VAIVAETLPGVQVVYAPRPDEYVIRWLSHWEFRHLNVYAIAALFSTLMAFLHLVALFIWKGELNYLPGLVAFWGICGAIAEFMLLIRCTVADGTWHILLPVSAMILLLAAACLSIAFRASLKFED